MGFSTENIHARNGARLFNGRAGSCRGITAALLALAVVLALAAVPTRASAKLCGDDVNGEDVPCACGDTVASDLTLGDDPVLSMTCPNDGLIVRAPSVTSSLTIDLAGHALTGSGSGVGLWLLHGGPSGARVISSGGQATITGFRDGVVAHGANAVALIDGLAVRSSARDGVRLSDVSGTALRHLEVQRSGRDGISVGGKDFTLADTRSVDSQRNGYHIVGGGGTVGEPGAGNVADGSGHVGFAMMGMNHRVVGSIASGSGGDGLRFAGAHYDVSGCQASNNGGDGLSGRGMGWRLENNQASDNDEHGIVVQGPDMMDAGGNRGEGNRGLSGSRPAVQCEINRAACTQN